MAAGRAAIMVICMLSGKRILVERATYRNNLGGGMDTVGIFRLRITFFSYFNGGKDS